MVKKIKKVVPRETTKSIATLVYPSGFTDECPSNWYGYIHIYTNINVSVDFEIIRNGVEK